jgi:tRNA/tmRNA/rRNA uracil-C5-methylase (TrmA/RlmC/RlmD family)
MRGPEPVGTLTADDLAPGVEVELDIGPVAHGGHCVARFDGRVVFVRLALPGERALVRITEAKQGSFCRGEAIEVLVADARRVEAPCPHFHPGGCGGCDFQHADGALQRELKAAVVEEQLLRLAGIEWEVEVKALPGSGFGWRSRVRWALDPAGRIGPRGVRSHRVEGVNPAAPCLIAVPELTPLAAAIEVPPGVRPPHRGRQTRGADRRPAGGRGANRGAGALPEVALCRDADGATTATWIGLPGPAPVVRERALGRDFSVAADGFWQAHVDAADVLAGAVGEAISGDDLTGRSAWDLYGGVGLFAEVLCRAVGPDGSVVSVESDVRAAELAVGNLSPHPQAGVRVGKVEHVLTDLPDAVDVVVLDPPRSGAGPALCAQIADRHPSVIVYVACDPAALARDAAALARAGYRLDRLEAFDAFPQTHHVECVARFRPCPVGRPGGKSAEPDVSGRR